jgi:3-phenylpropionate/trans-cinnamate dioxygenase ferredoxin reductase component
MKRYKYLIIGGGMTADAAVKGIREIDTEGEIGILTEESDPPYDRPPLSKGLWKGKPLEKIWCATESRGAALAQGRRAVSLDPGHRQVVDNQGSSYSYEKLLLATGGIPNRPSFKCEGVIFYRTLQDYRDVRALADVKNHFGIVGGGFIGAEMAAALAMNGKQATIVFPDAGINGRIFPAELSQHLNAYYRAKGVAVLPGRNVARIEPQDGGYQWRLDDGSTGRVDAVVAGVGISPNVILATGAGLDVGDGLLVDEQLRASEPSVYAAGDVARFFNPALSRRLRVEHEDNARTMGRMAGRNMAGDRQLYHHLPYFYSDLFDHGYEAVGETDSTLETFAHWEEPHQKGAIFYLGKERVRGLVFWNIFGKVEAGRELIAAPGPFDRDGLKAWYRERISV